MEYYYIMIPYVVGYFCTLYLIGYYSKWDIDRLPHVIFNSMFWPILFPIFIFYFSIQTFFKFMAAKNAP